MLTSVVQKTRRENIEYSSIAAMHSARSSNGSSCISYAIACAVHDVRALPDCRFEWPRNQNETHAQHTGSLKIPDTNATRTKKIATSNGDVWRIRRRPQLAEHSPNSMKSQQRLRTQQIHLEWRFHQIKCFYLFN